MSYHETHKLREHGKPPKFSDINYFDWLEDFTNYLKTCYCGEALCTLNALNKDGNFDEDTSDELRIWLRLDLDGADTPAHGIGLTLCLMGTAQHFNSIF